MSRLMSKPTFCICKTKGTDQLSGNCLCFLYKDSTIRLLSKSKISSLKPSSVLVQFELCRSCLETTLLVISWDGSNVVDISCRHLEVTVNGCVKKPYHQNTGSIKMHRVWSVKEGKWAPANWGLREIDGLVVPRGKASTERPSDYWLTTQVCQEKCFSQTNHIYNV